MKVLVTGGCGFIGSALVRQLIRETDVEVVNVDNLTYAATDRSVAEIAGSPRYAFERADIADGPRIRDIFNRHSPDGVIHLAAESHVDRSIDAPGAFVQTNVVGTYTLLACAEKYWRSLSGARHAAFRFVHVSTDEVYGSLGESGQFTEDSPYRPNSPYAATKAASDHLARSWNATYGLPTIVTNASNNYGPYQFPEKLIPRSIIRALRGQPIEVYGRGENIRDWLFVDDHARGLWRVFTHGEVGRTYNFGSQSECKNIALVGMICDALDRERPANAPHSNLVQFVTDRPGHDFRYALDANRACTELGWRPAAALDEGLVKTVRWYIANAGWWEPILNDGYNASRLGLATA